MAFHVMIKPVGALCNLSCDYCFFLPKINTLNSRFVMSYDTLEAFTRWYIESQPPGLVVFTWQGGEPTLAGIDFFRQAVDLQKKYCPPDKTIANDLQTNGQLINDDWCSFLKQKNFLVGLSLDGPEELHNLYRHTPGGEASFKAALNAAHLFRKYDIPFNTLTVLNRFNAKNPDDVYYFLRDVAGASFMQFLPLVEPKTYCRTPPAFWKVENLPQIGAKEAKPGHEASFVMDWCVDPMDFGSFLSRIFDLWLKDDLGKIVIPIFESVLSSWLGQKVGLCVFDNACGHALAMDHDGSIYFCDRFCFSEYKLGNVMDKNLKGGALLEQLSIWGRMKSAVSPQCKTCEWAFICKGECPKNRFIKDNQGNLGLNYLCPGLKILFKHIAPTMKKMASQLSFNK